MPAADPKGVLKLVMEDSDFGLTNDFMGMCSVALKKGRAPKPVKMTFKLRRKDGQNAGKKRGEIDIVLHWRYNPELDEGKSKATKKKKGLFG
eukprot:CAMPEP_0182538636 /NCGR_PEP_ID=MMETSP1323-20130603/23998_1 /TAXON_ID=236787 /ORGANISM="Florenciella parvula, Strain RCC1693" /LENGTH=91 /DNA_ID=CAMNT_0024749117 /DNA_START=123 /DNA_END=398 /DNA_ORIENTATION=+